MSGNLLTFSLGDLAPGSTARILYRVRVGANAREGRQENTAIASGAFASGERTETQPAHAAVQVGGGAFSTRQIFMGRVFDDVNRNGTFDDGDEPVAGIRLYLNSGQSVITDSQGLYNFPSLGDGAQVISLDPVSLPSGYALTDGGTLAGRSWTRLLRTPLGGGALLRQNFALVRPAGALRASTANSKEKQSSRASSEPSAAGQINNNVKTAQDASARNAKASETVKTAFGTPAGVDGASSTAAALTNAAQPSAGKYEMTSTETLEPVAPGEVRILSPAAGAVVMSPAMQLDARVALNWTIKLEVNGSQVSDQNIGTSRLDQKNNVSTFTFIGISLRPGPNRVRATAISAEGNPGRTEEITVMGRGPVRRLEIVARSDGSSSRRARIRERACSRLRPVGQSGD